MEGSIWIKDTGSNNLSDILLRYIYLGYLWCGTNLANVFGSVRQRPVKTTWQQGKYSTTRSGGFEWRVSVRDALELVNVSVYQY